MRTFRDNAGRTWSVQVDVDAIRRVRTALKLNLTNTDFSAVLGQLLSDPVLLCDVIYVLCKPEADKLNVSDVDFGRAMAGDAIDHATRAFLEELADFTPNQRDRALVQRVVRAMFQMAERTRDLVEKELEPGIEKAVAEALAEIETTFGRSSGGSPASSASTPVR